MSVIVGGQKAEQVTDTYWYENPHDGRKVVTLFSTLYNPLFTINNVDLLVSGNVMHYTSR